MFSASLPPVTISAVLAGIEVMEKEPWRVQKLRENVDYVAEKMSRFGLACEPQAAIIALKVPPEINIRNLARQFHEAGIFVNAVEYPAVPLNKQRFRISLMTDHTLEDINRLVETVEMIWNRNIYQEVA
jgi:glycine C-acetyltransferase